MVKRGRGRPKKQAVEEIEIDEIEEEEDFEGELDEDDLDVGLTSEDDEDDLGDVGLEDEEDDPEEEVDPPKKTGYAKIVEDTAQKAFEAEEKRKAEAKIAKKKAQLEADRNSSPVKAVRAAKTNGTKPKPEVVEGLRDQLKVIDEVLDSVDDLKLRKAGKHVVQALVWFESYLKMS